MRSFVFGCVAVILLGAFANPVARAAVTYSATPPAQKLYEKTYGSWIYRCAEVTASGQKPVKSCQVFQQMVVKKDGHDIPLATLIFEKANHQAGYDLSAVLPLGILLPAGVSFSTDTGSPITKAVDFCTEGGCVIIPQSSEGLVDELKDGKDGHIQFIYMNGRKITVNFSLNGFSDAMNAFDEGDLPPEVRKAS